MIGVKHVVVCDACGECTIAIDKGDQRESFWMPPAGWTIGTYNSDVHFCPKCTGKLNNSKSANENKIAYRSNAEEL